MQLISVVIPCHNRAARYLPEALASVRAQTYTDIEIILVNDGADSPAALDVLNTCARHVDQYISQVNRGLPTARNVGFRAAQGKYIIPLDADDALEPEYARLCAAALDENMHAAFAYTDYVVFGARRYVERLHDYNFYELLDQNTLTYAAMIRKADWEAVGGYDESMRAGYEDWDFWLRLGQLGRFGHHLPLPLFRYRRQEHSFFDEARARHDEIAACIRAKCPAIYSYSGRAAIKRKWQPSACVVSTPPVSNQTLLDAAAIDFAGARGAVERSCASAFVVCRPPISPRPESAELAVLAVWGGAGAMELPDGSLAISPRELASTGGFAGIRPQPPLPAKQDTSLTGPTVLSSRIHLLRRHLLNAGLLSVENWRKHPVQSLLRLLPLRLKERINDAARRPIFDLRFYLQFQPSSVLLSGVLQTPPRYMPEEASSRPRIALVTPHLGPGGAERVLLDAAAAIRDRGAEVFVVATQSADRRWISSWQAIAHHIYDLRAFVPAERVGGALYAILHNWRMDCALIQNSMAAYSIVPQLKAAHPGIRICDLIHAVDSRHDMVSSTAAVDRYFDTRIAVSESVRARLLRSGTADERIRLIRNAIPLAYFPPCPLRPSDQPPRILFAGRLDPVKRPLLLPDIAGQLLKMGKRRDFRFVVAGDGPDEALLRRRVRRAGVSPYFTFLGHIGNVSEALGECDLVLIPSQNEGVPLILLEALASCRPVVASDVGAIAEVLSAEAGVLIPAGTGEAARFARAIVTLLEDPGLRQRMGAAGRRIVEAGYDINGMREAYSDVLFAGCTWPGEPAAGLPREAQNRPLRTP